MTDHVTQGRYPGYDVLAKRNTPSWNERTREVVDARVAIEPKPRFFQPEEWRTLEAMCDRVMPQPVGRPRVPIAALVDRQMLKGKTKGYRLADMPQPGEAWRQALAALEEAATRDHGRSFAILTASNQDAMLRQMQDGELQAEALRGMPAKTFWTAHVNHDLISSYYSHPEAWSEMGWGGPASPRGYVRLDLDTRDLWEPAEAKPGHEAKAERENKRVV